MKKKSSSSSSYSSSSSSVLYNLAEEIKTETFEFDTINTNPYLFVSPSAYDTAWLAMIEDFNDVGPKKPMFRGCLDWILSNQNVVEGFWGNNGDETLISTIACVVALRKWNVGSLPVQKGKRYIERSTENLIEKYNKKRHSYPRWFVLMFTGLIQLSQKLGLNILFSTKVKEMIGDLFFQRQEILNREKLMDSHFNLNPLLAYLEVLPSTIYDEIQEELIVAKLDNLDGSLYQSPSATAAAFMITHNKNCLAYLQSLVQKCPSGVPQIYPMSEKLIKLSMANLMNNLGLGEYFGEEIDHFLLQTYKSYEFKDAKRMNLCSKVDQLHKASLEFRMLRSNGYDVSPKSFCWFLNDPQIIDHLETNIECFVFVMISIYRATDLMFPGECQLKEAREFSLKLLEKIWSFDEEMVASSHIKHETSTPWMARLKHLDHRMWIEDKDSNAFSIGKAFSIRLYSEKLLQLASKTFELRQAVYRQEMDDLMKWVKKWGLKDIGFGRDKTAYCYFAASSSTSLPFESASAFRKLMAKSGIIITIADDFFDEEGSEEELEDLTISVLRWKGEELKGHGDIIFKALVNLVNEIAYTCLKLHGTDITQHLQNIWGETFESWLREAEWSKKAYIPSMEEYLQNGMISTAAHTIVLPMSCLMESCFPLHKLKPGNYDNTTKLVMIITRLLNDLQSYQKEQEQGKINSVLIHMKSHSGFKIEKSIAYTENIIDSKRKEFVKHVLMDELSELPKPCKDIHMSFCNVFEMFFNKKNRYDSDTEMLQDIKKALYDPIKKNN